MSVADTIFINMCRDVIENGTSTEGEKVRPVWEDGTPAYTIKKFGVVNRYDLRKEFPALTLRKTALKSAMDEILWIWQKKSNNIHDLNSHIWDSWADETGSIGKAYGYQMQVKHEYKEGMMDQVDRVLYDLKHNPYSRRIMTNIYVHQDLHEMNLYPCAYSGSKQLECVPVFHSSYDVCPGVRHGGRRACSCDLRLSYLRQAHSGNKRADQQNPVSGAFCETESGD